MDIKIKDHAQTYKVDVLNKSSNLCTHAIIGISVENPRHSGEKFYTLLNWALEKFHSVEVNVFDQIHSYNIQFISNCSFQDALDQANNLGQEWIANNNSILKMHPSVKINTYKNLIADIPYNERFNQLLSLYEEDYIFRNLINCEIESFSTRRQIREGVWSQPILRKFYEFSKLYILDELATMSLLNEKSNFVEIYAGRFLNILKSPDRLNVVNLPNGLRDYPLIEVDFVRRTKKREFKDAA